MSDNNRPEGQEVSVTKLFGVGKYNEVPVNRRGHGPWQACLVIADTEEQAINLANGHFDSYWREHLAPEPTVILLAESMTIAPGGIRCIIFQLTDPDAAAIFSP